MTALTVRLDVADHTTDPAALPQGPTALDAVMSHPAERITAAMEAGARDLMELLAALSGQEVGV